MVIGRNRPDPTKKTQQFGAAAASYSPRRSRRSNMQCPRSTGPGTHLVTDRQGQVARPVIDSGDTRLVAADVVK